MPKNYLFLAFLWLFIAESRAQSILDIDRDYYPNAQLFEDVSLIGDDISRRATNTTPPGSPVRPMAEWEEIDAIAISWTQFHEALANIVRIAQNEVKVYINCPGSAEETRKELQLFFKIHGASINENVIFLENQDFNSVWIRDYGPNSAYLNEVDSLIFVDWVYNREERPDDDTLPENFAEYVQTPLFETIEGDFRLTATGGNFMSDGIATGFSSKLIIDENEDKNELEIDQIMNDFLGVQNYVKFDKLQYDGIHHIDMHMKLLDEERIMFGEYPEGVADHDVIEANIEYLLATQKNAFGEQYEIIRIPMPPNFEGLYPGQGGDKDLFRTYTNALFLNKTIIVPIYQPIYDSTALRIWKEAMPGYNIHGVSCNSMIDVFSAVHCVTKEIGSKNPLRIVFQRIKDQEEAQYQGYNLDAIIQHRSGIEKATLYFREKGTEIYDRIPMQVKDIENDIYTATIPNILDFGTIEYYVEAKSKSGKEMARPQPAPVANYSFDINLKTAVSHLAEDVFSSKAFPNPSSGMVCIPVQLNQGLSGELSLIDIHGRHIEMIHSGEFSIGSSKYFINVANFPSGIYSLRLSTAKGVKTQKLVVKN